MTGKSIEKDWNYLQQEKEKRKTKGRLKSSVRAIGRDRVQSKVRRRTEREQVGGRVLCANMRKGRDQGLPQRNRILGSNRVEYFASKIRVNEDGKKNMGLRGESSCLRINTKWSSQKEREKGTEDGSEFQREDKMLSIKERKRQWPDYSRLDRHSYGRRPQPGKKKTRRGVIRRAGSVKIVIRGGKTGYSVMQRLSGTLSQFRSVGRII